MTVPAVREVGRFRIDLARRRLETTEGLLVPLTGKAFDALVCLLNRAGEPVSRKALMQELWPDRVVEDNNLTQAIAALREALGKDYIVTLPGRGYQLAVIPREAERHHGDLHWLASTDRRFALIEGNNVIGRDPQADVWLDAATVSRRHARIFVSSNGAVLEDLGSKNGTSIGGIRLREPTALRDGDPIGLGSLRLTYRAPAARTATVTKADRVDSPQPPTDDDDPRAA